mmetsp:Transcript_54630/g.173534  ORF Transcript_54630/g.173534 Transcript_54630/m.173534 type:complete len:250 (-) Transcript_54630:318-1067(-)
MSWWSAASAASSLLSRLRTCSMASRMASTLGVSSSTTGSDCMPASQGSPPSATRFMAAPVTAVHSRDVEVNLARDEEGGGLAKDDERSEEIEPARRGGGAAWLTSVIEYLTAEDCRPAVTVRWKEALTPTCSSTHARSSRLRAPAAAEASLPAPPPEWVVSSCSPSSSSRAYTAAKVGGLTTSTSSQPTTTMSPAASHRTAQPTWPRSAGSLRPGTKAPVSPMSTSDAEPPTTIRTRASSPIAVSRRRM